MINLLPPSEKKEIEREKIFRIICHFQILIFFFLISLSLCLYFLLIYFQQETAKIENLLFSQKLFSEKSLEKEIEEKNEMLSKVLKSREEKKYFGEILDEISKILPPQIKIRNLKLVLNKDKKVEISISGVASKREDLLQLRTTLSEKFDSVSFPPEIWFEKENINFSVTFKEK